MDSEFSQRDRIRMGLSPDEPMVKEQAQSPATRSRADLHVGPPEGFRPRLIQAVASAGGGVGVIAVAMAFIMNGAWAFLSVIAFALSMVALKMANEDLQTYGEGLQEPYATELRGARTWAIGSLAVIGALLLLLVLAMMGRIIYFQMFGTPAGA
ncbi:MAG TPA: hypothetical protein VGN57_14190 [Pirellulaceae bacterium]|jgi:hypothetical protein|nr:hypothetical protein [Pirellulaceae bacterium]